jgi:hypothetical protein
MPWEQVTLLAREHLNLGCRVIWGHTEACARQTRTASYPKRLPSWTVAEADLPGKDQTLPSRIPISSNAKWKRPAAIRNQIVQTSRFVQASRCVEL